MSDQEMEPQTMPLACMIHQTRKADFVYETQKEIAEFGKIRYGLCKFCEFRKRSNAKGFGKKIADKINSVLLAQREINEHGQS